MKTSLYAILLAFLAVSITGCKPEEPILKSLEFENTELSLEVGDVVKLEVVISPADAVGYTLQWQSSDETVVSVTNEGEVTALTSGTADITVSNSGISAVCAVTVTAPLIPVESVSLDVTQLELGVGETHSLQATVFPENATDKTVSWSSSAPEIVSVDENGTVEGLAKGDAVITATTTDGGKTAECTVTVARTTNGYEYVDLGLSVIWATCNVGAENPWDYGDYFAWGEIAPKEEYSIDNCTTYEVELPDISGNPDYDAAAAIWGGTWRLPNGIEMQELIDECTWEWTTQEGSNGYEVTGPNGNSIFLPAPGWRIWSSLNDDGNYGGYWISNPYRNYTDFAYSLVFDSTSYNLMWSSRAYGHSIRPVSD